MKTKTPAKQSRAAKKFPYRPDSVELYTAVRKALQDGIPVLRICRQLHVEITDEQKARLAMPYHFTGVVIDWVHSVGFEPFGDWLSLMDRYGYVEMMKGNAVLTLAHRENDLEITLH